MKKLIALFLTLGVVAQISAGCCKTACEKDNCSYEPKPICRKFVTKEIRRPAIAHKSCQVTYTCPTDCETAYDNK